MWFEFNSFTLVLCKKSFTNGKLFFCNDCFSKPLTDNLKTISKVYFWYIASVLSFFILLLTIFLHNDDDFDSHSVEKIMEIHKHKISDQSNFSVYFEVRDIHMKEGKLKIHLEIESKKEIKDELKVKIVDPSAKFFKTTSKTILKTDFKKMTYFHTDLDISLVILPNVQMINIPQNITIKLEEDVFNFEIKMEWFPLFIEENRNLFKCSLDEINVLFVGIQGSGKSSCVNTQKSSISSDISELALVMKNDYHVTRNFQKYSLKHISKTSLSIYDGFGLDKDTYSDEILYCLLEGKLPTFTVDDAKKYVSSNSTKPLCSHNEHKSINDIVNSMHCVILFLTFDQINNFKNKKSEDVNISIKRKLIVEKKQLIVLVQYMEGVQISEEELLKQQEVIRKDVYEYIGVSKGNIFLYLAYGNQLTKKNLLIDRNAAQIRDQIRKNAFTYLERQKELWKISNFNLFWNRPWCSFQNYLKGK
jgi:predicted AAA+ superfamily ATPase